MSGSSPPTKVASHDMQLAMLVNMGFDEVKAERALKVNEWNVDQSIDYLICRGVVSDAASVVQTPGEEDVEKNEERRLRQSESSSSTLEVSNNFEAIERRRQRDDLVHGGRADQSMLGHDRGSSQQRVHTSQRHRQDSSTNRVAMAAQARRSQPLRVSAGPVPRSSYQQPQQIQSIRRGDGGGLEATDRNLEQRRRIQHHGRSRGRQHQQDRYDNDEFGFPSEVEKVDRAGPKHSFEDRLEGGYATGTPAIFTDDEIRKAKAAQHPGAEVVYGLPSMKESMAYPTSRRQVTDDGTSSVNAVAECVGVAADSVSAESPGAAVEIASPPSSEDRNRRDIRRLYILVGAAMILVLVGVGVAVGMVVAQGDRNSAASESTSAPEFNASTTTERPTSSPVLSPTTTSPPASEETTETPATTTTDVPGPTTAETLRVPLKGTAEPTSTPTTNFVTRRQEHERGRMALLLRRGRQEH